MSGFTKASHADQGLLKKNIPKVVCSMLETMSHNLFSLSEESLRKQWFFKWNDSQGVADNIYHFTEMLQLYKSRCRRWEEYHYGGCCVVERVRDKYLMPRIKDFQEVLMQKLSK